MNYKYFIGIDMSKLKFDYCVRLEDQAIEQNIVENTKSHVDNWLVDLNHRYEKSNTLFAVEHTGVYSYILIHSLAESGFACVLINPKDLKYSLGISRGKSDPIDSSRIAEYTMRFIDKLRLWKPKRAVVEILQALMVKRKQLISMKKISQQYSTETKTYHRMEVSAYLDQLDLQSPQTIKKDITMIDKCIEELIVQDEHLKRIVEVATSAPGIGIQTACELLIGTNEFKDFSNAKKIACHAGVAPFEYSSGSSVCGRSKVNHNANKKLKTALHMAALSTISTQGRMRDYYDRKVAQGKNKMSVINGIRNKLIHLVFALVDKNTMYEENYQYKFA